MPSRLAVFATFGRPTWSATLAATVLIDWTSASFSVIGPRLPGSKLLVDQRRLWRHPGLERGQVDERLPRRARLPVRVDRAVEAALRIVGAADHGAHPALRVERHQRRLLDVVVREAGDGGVR